MDFSQWSPSHSVLVLFIILGFVGQIGILFYRTSRLEKRADKTDERIDKFGEDFKQALKEQGETFFHALERLEDRMDKRLSDMQAETNTRLSDIEASIRQLNQNHIDHLTHHERS